MHNFTYTLKVCVCKVLNCRKVSIFLKGALGARHLNNLTTKVTKKIDNDL